MFKMILRNFLLLMFIVVSLMKQSQTFQDIHNYHKYQSFHNYHDYPSKDTGYKHDPFKGECNSDQLTCVPEDDCDLECPYGFQKLGNGGACYYISNEEYNPKRTLHDAEDYCDVLNSRLLWLEDSKELRDLISFYKNSKGEITQTTSTMPTTEVPVTEVIQTEEPITDAPMNSIEARQAGPDLKHELFFIATEYEKSKGSWIWRGTHDKIDWDILLFGTANAEESLRILEGVNINKCLTLNLTAAIEVNGPIIEESDCILENGFICKIGNAKARCSKSSSTKCCFTPSYDFYIQNREKSFANFNFKPGGCQIVVADRLLRCDEVVEEIEKEQNATNHHYSVARVGSSYYYIANATDECIGREAIIQNENVHSFVTQLLATRENYYADKNIKIGLIFKLENRMAYWVNGKPDDYYDQFWIPGEPKRDDSVDGGCAAYSNIDGTATFLWRLFSKEMCATFEKICELPLQKSSKIDRTKEESCGKRYERGALAKAVYSIYSSDEANFGEFPWQAAIMYPEKYGREVKRKFACSGALIHESFVLTSAHCVTSVNVQSDFLVVLGQHDLFDDSYILEPLVIDVKEVILHKDFNVRKSSIDDLALLQLDRKVNTTVYPHIGLGCLPDPDEIRSHGGNWECFITGWSTNKYRYSSKVLKRLEAEFTSEEYCRYLNKDHYDLLFKRKRYGYGYKKHHAYYRDEDSELLCTNSPHNECLEDQSPLLVCKKASEYVKKPFYSKDYGQNRYKNFKGRDAGEHEFDAKNFVKKRHLPLDEYESFLFHEYGSEETIINAYGEDRFNSEKWYIIGIGNTKSQCRDFEEYYSKGYGVYDSPYRGSAHFKSILREDVKSQSEKKYTKREHLSQHDPGVGNIYGEEDYSAKVPHRGLNYKTRFRRTEVFTSVYDYINFIYYILDLHR